MRMVEKGEISSYSYKTIVQIPPFSTILVNLNHFFDASGHGRQMVEKGEISQKMTKNDKKWQ